MTRLGFVKAAVSKRTAADRLGAAPKPIQFEGSNLDRDDRSIVAKALSTPRVTGRSKRSSAKRAFLAHLRNCGLPIG
jgi:hypothetical protein